MGKRDDYNCDPNSGGASVFICEYGSSTLQYVSNKKSAETELKAIDACAEHFDGDPAKVQMPKQEEGYYVFATVKAKPNNGKDAPESSVLLVPDPQLELCNDTATEGGLPGFETATSCTEEGLIPRGLVTSQGVYDLTEQGFERFDTDSGEKGKGRNKAKDITGLFTWTGYVCDDSLDVSGPDGVPDGVIDEFDIPGDFVGTLEEYLDAQVLLGLCTKHESEWVFNIADLVVQDQDIGNDGVKLLKVRFYPVATTVFVQQ